MFIIGESMKFFFLFIIGVYIIGIGVWMFGMFVFIIMGVGEWVGFNVFFFV